MGAKGTTHEDATRTQVIDWLLEPSQPSVRLYTLTGLLGRNDRDLEVRRARSAIGRVGWAAELLERQQPAGYWEAREPSSVRRWLMFLQFPLYRSTLWRALVLADLGLTSSDPRVRRTAEQIFEYKLKLSSPVNFYTEEVCAVGNVARLLTRLGYGDDRRVRKLQAWMIEDQREDGGWNCAPDRPGTLDCWQALAAFAEVPPTERSVPMQRAIERGAEFYLERNLFREGKRYAPWFRFHYPTHYFYDLLVGLDVLTRLGYAEDRRLGPALQILREKRRPDGTWAADRIHPDEETATGRPADTKNLHGWSLEAAGRPSKWITLTALRVLRRVDSAAG
jgi:hypothetical protein